MSEVSPSTPAIRASSLRFGYGKALLFDRFDLDIPQGVTTGIVGPNGSGKSTLLKLFCGLLVPQAGEICLATTPLSGLSDRERAKLIAFMPQDNPAVHMSVADLVMSGRFCHQGFLHLPSSEDELICQEAMELAGLSGLSLRSVGSLSGGQRQRAYFAMVLAQRAGTLLLDEPTSALDIGASHQVMRLVCDIQAQRGGTTVVVLHDLDLALRYCDHVIVMQDGRVAAQGTANQLADAGVLGQVFGVHIHSTQTPFGRCWSFFPDPQGD